LSRFYKKLTEITITENTPYPTFGDATVQYGEREQSPTEGLAETKSLSMENSQASSCVNQGILPSTNSVRADGWMNKPKEVSVT
jgi:hypothetical protein